MRAEAACGTPAAAAVVPAMAEADLAGLLGCHPICSLALADSGKVWAANQPKADPESTCKL